MKPLTNQQPKNKSSINYTADQLFEKYGGNLPQYISDFFYDISKEIETCGNDKIKRDSILNKVNDKELFVLQLNTYLEKNIDVFLEMNADEVIDY